MGDVEYAQLLYISQHFLEWRVRQNLKVDRIDHFPEPILAMTVGIAVSAVIVEAFDSYLWAHPMAVFEDFLPLQVFGHLPVLGTQHFSCIQILLSPNNLKLTGYF